MPSTRTLAVLAAALALSGSAASAAAQQSPVDPVARLRAVLPARAADQILARLAQARAAGLPAEALANRALKFAAKGVSPDAIARAVDDQLGRMQNARSVLQSARGRAPAPEEIEAGAEAMRIGVSGAQVSELARSAPAGRSLAVPLYVMGSLVNRGLSADSALARVRERLAARVSDSDLERLPGQIPGRPDGADGNPGDAQGAVPGHAAAAGPQRPAQVGQALAATRRPGSAGGAGHDARPGNGPPPGVPGNAGKPVSPGKPPNIPPGQARKPGNPGPRRP